MPPPPAEPARDPVSQASHPKVVVEPSLQGLLLQSQPVVTRGEFSKTLGVNVPIRTVLDADFSLQYRFVFYSPDGAEENPDTPWRFVTLPPRSQRVLAGQSLRSETADWRLELRSLP